MLLTYTNFQVMVVDNGSEDDSSRSIRKDFPDVLLVELDKNLGFAGGNNEGLNYALEENYPYILLLNNDTAVLDGDFLRNLVQVLEDDLEIGAVGPLVEQTDGKSQLSILPYPSLSNTIKNSLGLYAPDHNQRQYVDSLAGCCVLVRREAVKIAGLLDDNYFMYGEETEWFYRMRKAGWKVLYLPVESIVHKGGSSSKRLENQAVYIERRANVVYTLVKHHQKIQAALIIILMFILLSVRILASVFRTNQKERLPISMVLTLITTFHLKWNLAVNIRR